VLSLEAVEIGDQEAGGQAVQQADLPGEIGIAEVVIADHAPVVEVAERLAVRVP
jgi:hypothetical protein